jgi:DNA invertase Pin-like site-specific DNA recombinase
MNQVRSYKTACGYIRSSAQGEQLDQSLIQQSSELMDYCIWSHQILLQIAVETTSDGTHSELPRLIEEATSVERPFDVFVVHDESRLSRDPATLATIRFRLAAANVELVVLGSSPVTLLKSMNLSAKKPALRLVVGSPSSPADKS